MTLIINDPRFLSIIYIFLVLLNPKMIFDTFRCVTVRSITTSKRWKQSSQINTFLMEEQLVQYLFLIKSTAFQLTNTNSI